MSKTKVLITIEGGNIQVINATDDLDILVIDLDNPENGDDLVYRYGIDRKFKSGEAHQLFDDVYPLTPLEAEARDELKRLKF